MVNDLGPVAQLDRALPSEGRGREFESRRVRQFSHIAVRRLRISAQLTEAHTLHREFADVTLTSSPSGNVMWNARPGSHDDRMFCTTENLLTQQRRS
jgi:hypothetical protein